MRPTIRLQWTAKATQAAFAGMFTCAVLGASVPSETRSILQEWVEVKALISEEKEDWAVEKATLTDTIDLLEEEKSMLADQIEAREAAAEAAADQRTELSVRKEELEAEATALSEVLAGYEAELVEWVESLPEMLKEELGPLLRRLPEDGKSAGAGLARRLQTVVGILSQTDKFNSSLSIRSELRSIGGSGAPRETDTLYFGLAYAVFADAEGQAAGFGTPGPDGWTWTDKPEAASAIRKLIAVYKNDQPAAYVEVPVTID